MNKTYAFRLGEKQKKSKEDLEAEIRELTLKLTEEARIHDEKEREFDQARLQSEEEKIKEFVQFFTLFIYNLSLLENHF